MIATILVFVTQTVTADTISVQLGDVFLKSTSLQTSNNAFTRFVRLKELNTILFGKNLQFRQNVDSIVDRFVNNYYPVEEVVDEQPQYVSAPAEQTNYSQPTPVSSVPTAAEEYAAKEEIARRESGGSYTAQNGQFYGRYQLMLTYLNGDLSPENQERVADAYVKSRYGSWTAALAFSNANGWY
ncbi:aggregation-promoting factor C-terminal-like domain-containing protein [Streptococcus cameli]